MEQQRNARKGSRLQRQIEELQKRMEAVEDILDNAKEVLTVEEASRFMDIARSSLYKMTSDRSIPFYRPNGKMIYFEKADILAWIRQNRALLRCHGRWLWNRLRRVAASSSGLFSDDEALPTCTVFFI